MLVKWHKRFPLWSEIPMVKTKVDKDKDFGVMDLEGFDDGGAVQNRMISENHSKTSLCEA